MDRVVVVMGVAGSGKTIIGRLLADRLGLPYAEGDAFHPKANVDKMAAGHPLTDADRWPWLRAIAGWIRLHDDGGVITCSALKRAYRDLLRSDRTWFLHPHGDRAVITARLRARTGHFMPPALLDSQLADLEPLEQDEPGLVVDVSHTPEEIVEFALRALDGLS
jgi:gluconokinase